MREAVNINDFYLSHGIISDPGEYADLYDCLPDTVGGIVDSIRHLFLHIFWAHKYGVELTDTQRRHIESRHVKNILKTIMDMDNSPLSNPRSVEYRFIGNCRDYSVFLCSILRSKGIPARARCGFARYFTAGEFMDHWTCEYWDSQEKKWITVDPQLDELQMDVLNINFNPLDVPEGQFISGAEGWRLCRTGREDSDHFGIANMHGLWFVRGNLIRDLACLNKVELLPWDSWGLIEGEDRKISSEGYELLDRLSRLVISEDWEMYKIYNDNPELRVPGTIRCYSSSGVLEIPLYSME